MEVYGVGNDKVKKVYPVGRALLDKWEECVEPLTRFLEHWEVWLCMAEKLSVPKGKGGLFLSRNFRCGEWGVVAEWMKAPCMKLRVLHMLEFAERVAEEQRWSRGSSDFFQFACTFRQHEMTARMITHRLPWVEAFSKPSEKLPASVFKRTRVEYEALDDTTKAALEDGLEASREGVHNDLRFWMVQWTEVDALFGLVTHPTFGPEFVRQVLSKIRPSWFPAHTTSAAQKKDWKKLSQGVDKVHKKRITDLLTKSWHRKYRKGLDELGNVKPEYDVWSWIAWYWDYHDLDLYKLEWLDIATSAEFAFTRHNVSDPFYDSQINNRFVSSMSNEKVKCAF